MSNTSSSRRGYGIAYQRARAELLKDNPPCHWCGKPATTADHEPPIEAVGKPHLSLVPACVKCNMGRRGKHLRTVRTEPSRVW